MNQISLEVRRHSPQSPWTYQQLDHRQREIASQIRLNHFPGILLVSELAPVITIGRRTPEADLQPFQSLKGHTEVYPTDRGGLATYHGPGQWVLFPVDRLENLTGDSRGVRKAVDTLLQVALEVGLLYDPSAHLRSGPELGVWTQNGKFAAVGIHIEDGILLHGLAVNGFRTLESFQGLRPCGLDAPVDFLLKGERPEERFEDLGNLLIQSALEKFWNFRDFSPSLRLTESRSDAIS